MNPDDDPKHWKLGVFYYNPDNSSEFVDKRRGIGGTINFGSKLGRRIFALLFVPIVIVILLFIIIAFFK
ncbi:DUF5808 domain-containing protein [Clostridium kluyveri]|uniref:DUF5808 domain-containing protein n=1 Tax=Clostridium kluyveri TaxID=1534 RepID=UPI00224868C8|nr:DUF5808 domain-containing protein [Clostridium kluyveri]UZQ52039.1 DUF5808 domain-containing protein [Clostridium kluyveri]